MLGELYELLGVGTQQLVFDKKDLYEAWDGFLDTRVVQEDPGPSSLEHYYQVNDHTYVVIKWICGKWRLRYPATYDHTTLNSGSFDWRVEPVTLPEWIHPYQEGT